MKKLVCAFMILVGTLLQGAEPVRKPLAFYLRNLPQERVGGCSDAQIKAQLRRDGFIVIDVDCSAFPRTSPQLEEALVLFHKNSQEIYRSYETSAEVVDVSNIFYVPEGYTVTRNIPVWNILRHGAEGSARWVMDTWNSHIVSKYGMSEVSSPEQMTNPDGSPLDWNLYMDIVHPSGRACRKVPLLLNFASISPRMSSFRPDRPLERVYRSIFPLGFLTTGYAFAIYDHCYNPLARGESWKHFKQYTLDDYNALAASSAAVRYLRSHADEYNLDGKVGVMGISKASNSAVRVADRDNADGREFLMTGDASERKPQPWMGAESHVDMAYAAAGIGAERSFMYIDSLSCPLVTSAGLTDEYRQWDVYPDVVRHMEAVDHIHLALWMEDMGHTYPCMGEDFATGESRYVLFKRFFDSRLKPSSSADVLYVLPKEGCTHVDVFGRSRTLLPDALLPGGPSAYMRTFKMGRWASSYCGVVVRLATGEEKYAVFKDFERFGSDVLASDDIFYKDMLPELDTLSPITVRFMEEYAFEEVRKRVKITAVEDGASVDGEWTSSMRGTCFTFVPARQLEAGKEYRIEVPVNIRSLSGKSPSVRLSRSFLVFP